MAGFGSDLLDTPSTPKKKRKWTETGLTVLVGLIVVLFSFIVLSSGFQLVFQHGLFGK